MQEKIIPLRWEYINELMEQIDEHLLMAQMPTVLRLRAAMLTEELFSALIAAEGARTARVRCTYPAPDRVRFQYRNEKGPLAPELTALRRLSESPAAYGIKVQLEEGGCTLTVGVR